MGIGFVGELASGLVKNRPKYVLAILGTALKVGAAFWVHPLAGVVATQLALAAMILWELRRFTERVHREHQETQDFAQLLALTQPRLPLPARTSWSIKPDLCNLLFETVSSERPALIVEAGSGLSTLVMAMALKQGKIAGKILSLEASREYAEATVALLRRHGVSDYAQVIHAPLEDCLVGGETLAWYSLNRVCFPVPVDLVFVDGPVTRSWKSRYPALPLLLPKLRDGASFVLDDGSRKEERLMIDHWRKLYPTLAFEFLPLQKGAWRVRVPDAKQTLRPLRLVPTGR